MKILRERSRRQPASVVYLFNVKLKMSYKNASNSLFHLTDSILLPEINHAYRDAEVVNYATSGSGAYS